MSKKLSFTYRDMRAYMNFRRQGRSLIHAALRAGDPPECVAIWRDYFDRKSNSAKLMLRALKQAQLDI